MQRRHFHHATAAAVLAMLSRSGAALAAVPIRTDLAMEDDPYVVGLRSLMELSVRDAMDHHVDHWPPTIVKHLQDSWAEYTRLGIPNNVPGNPWTKYEAFESMARLAAHRMWELARDSLMVQVHLLGYTDVARLREAMGQKVNGGAWATAIFERMAGNRLLHRLLGEVVEIQLAWLLANRDRYPNNPAARYSQLEMQDWEICLRVTRALVYAIFDAIAAEEREWRLHPDKPGVSATMAAVLKSLGPPPATPMTRPERPQP